MYIIRGYFAPFHSQALYRTLLAADVLRVCSAWLNLVEFPVQMDQELAEKVLGSRDVPHGSRGLASLPDSKLLHPPVDLSLLLGSLKSSPLRHVSAGRRQKEDHPESGSGLVLMIDMESHSSESVGSYHKEEEVVYWK